MDGFEKPIQNHLRGLCMSSNCATHGGYSKSSMIRTKLKHSPLSSALPLYLSSPS